MRWTIGILEIDVKCPKCQQDKFLRDDSKDYYTCKCCGMTYGGEWLYYNLAWIPHVVIHNPLIEEMRKGNPPQ